MSETLDTEALRERYRKERDKRLRADGNDQYVEMAGRFAAYLDDPYTTPTPREPLFDETEIVLIGGGFGGLLAGARLRMAGFGDIRIIEKGGDFGGTWYWNRYPGAACDVESYIYLPLLEEMRRAQRLRDRSRLVDLAPAGLAEAADGELHQSHRRLAGRGRRPDPRRLDRRPHQVPPLDHDRQ
jgi:hypothetical protein